MKLKSCLLALTVFLSLLWVLISHIKLAESLQLVSNCETNLEIASDRHDDVLKKYVETLNEIAKYNLCYKIAPINLTKQLEMYEIEFVGSKNRISVAKHNLANAIMDYNNRVNNIFYLPSVVLFNYKPLEYNVKSITNNYVLNLIGSD